MTWVVRQMGRCAVGPGLGFFRCGFPAWRPVTGFPHGSSRPRGLWVGIHAGKEGRVPDQVGAVVIGVENRRQGVFFGGACGAHSQLRVRRTLSLSAQREGQEHSTRGSGTRDVRWGRC